MLLICATCTYVATCVWCKRDLKGTFDRPELVFCACLNSLDGLVMRFEAPDSRNRWDSPVFTIHASDSVPFDQVHRVLYDRQPPPPNLSTLPVSHEHVHSLSRIINVQSTSEVT